MIGALVSALPGLIKLIVALVGWLSDKGLVDTGRKLAMADALEASARELRVAQEVEIEADKAHAADPTDAALDREFERGE